MNVLQTALVRELTEWAAGWDYEVHVVQNTTASCGHSIFDLDASGKRYCAPLVLEVFDRHPKINGLAANVHVCVNGVLVEVETAEDHSTLDELTGSLQAGREDVLHHLSHTVWARNAALDNVRLRVN